MKVVLIDDEIHALENLEILLQNYFPEINILEKATSAIEGIKIINNCQPDVVFLDISMPHINGFELLDALGSFNFHVVFTTAYEEYSIEAIKKNAFDYILKPIDFDELKKCIENLKLQENKKGKLTINTVNSIEFVDFSDVVLCKSDSSYCHVFLKTGIHYFFTKKLKDLIQQLPKNKFMRCHNSYIINKDYVVRYNKRDGGYLELKTIEQSIPVSRSKKEEVLNWLRN